MNEAVSSRRWVAASTFFPKLSSSSIFFAVSTTLLNVIIFLMQDIKSAIKNANTNMIIFSVNHSGLELVRWTIMDKTFYYMQLHILLPYHILFSPTPPVIQFAGTKISTNFHQILCNTFDQLFTYYTSNFSNA